MRALYAGPGASRVLRAGGRGEIAVAGRAGAYARLGADHIHLCAVGAPFGPLTVAVTQPEQLDLRPGVEVTASAGELRIGGRPISLERTRLRGRAVAPVGQPSEDGQSAARAERAGAGAGEDRWKAARPERAGAGAGEDRWAARDLAAAAPRAEDDRRAARDLAAAARRAEDDRRAARAIAADAVLARLPPLPSSLAAGRRALEAGDLAAAVAALAGRGAGLTPDGDDVLAGYAAWRHATGEPVRLADAAAPLASPLGLSYLRCAERGELPDAAARVLAALLAGERATALPALLRWGSSSGAALAHGMVAGARRR